MLIATSLAVGVVLSPAAHAAPGQIGERSSEIVTADGLPTVQVDGVVWSQAIVGNTVYAGGSFANARPAGAAPGTNLTARANFLSYDLTTGALNTGFVPNTNAQVLVVAKSPDGSRVYIGGDFTAVNGVTRYRIAAFNALTGALITAFAPNVGAKVKSISVTDSAVYVGGTFTTVSGQQRGRLVALNPSNGAVLGWNPGADYNVNAVLVTPDKSRVIVGGQFQNLGTTPAYGLAAVDATTGAVLPWAATSTIQDAGPNSAILGLTTDGTNIYGNAYVFGTGGNFEGTFAADPTTGAIQWMEDCHGDTYANYPAATVVYTVSHAHYCGNMGGYGESVPRGLYMHHAVAFTKKATGTITPDPHGYPSWVGQPSPSQINWFPDMDNGSYTGQSQAAWAVTGNDQYVVLGGEFPTVNGIGQQGIVRFAVTPIAPAKRGPVLTGSKFMPSLNSFAAGTVRVAFQANYDQDDVTLNYSVIRDGDTEHPVYQTPVQSTFFKRPNIAFTDAGLTPGTTYRYRLYVTDAAGNQVIGDTATITASGTGSASTYANLIAGQGASNLWRLGDPAGSTAVNWAGSMNGTTGTGLTFGAPGALVGDPNTAATFNGTNAARVYSPVQASAPTVFSASAWVKTTTTSGGQIVGYGDSQTGNSTITDHMIYMDNTGRFNFGMTPRGNVSIVSPKAYRDGQWHLVVATLGPDGMRLYVDGAQVAARADTISGKDIFGYWRIGGDAIATGWSNKPASNFFNGSIDEVAIFPTALTSVQVATQWAIGKGQPPPNTPPVAAFTSTATVLTATFDASGSADPDGSVASYSWNFGDGTTGTGATPSHTYTATGTYTVALTVTDNGGATTTVSHPVSVTAPNVVPTAAFGTTVSGVQVTVDGSGSTDTDGTIVSYAWDFGDGTTGTGVTPPTHTYGADGTYTISLTVTDNSGATGAVTHGVSVSAVNDPPVAAFISTVNGLTANLDAGGSTDPDGSIASYAWDFGDSTTGTGSTASHAYAADGTYTVVLTVTDDAGATGTATHDVTVATPPNVPPTASFTSSSSGLTASVNGSGSTDPDGTVVGYAWNLGDGATATGSAASHTYSAGGTFPVTLTVTDDDGATGAVTKSVTVIDPAAPVAVATDAFARTIANGFGSADVGGSWTVNGSAALFSINGSSGLIRMAAANAGPSAILSGVSSSSVSGSFDFAMDKVATGSGTQGTVMVRRVVATNTDYRVKLRLMPTSTSVQISKVVGGVETSLRNQTVTGLTYAVGDTVRVSFAVTGTNPTTLSAKAWKVGTSEPAAFQTTVNDAEASLQGPGAIGLQAYLSSNATNAPVVGRFDNLTVTTRP